MRLAFLGTPDFAVPSLRALAAAGHEICLVVTNPDRPRGRSGAPVPPPVKAAALELGLALHQPEDPRSGGLAEKIRETRVELGVVVAFGTYLVRSAREAPSLGFMLNLHASLLPRWRGAAPVAAAIRAGDAVSGVSVQRVEKVLDGGPVCASREERVRPDDTRTTLEARLAQVGAMLLVGAVSAVEAGTAVFSPQDESRATYARELTKDDGRVAWNRPAVELERLTRAMDPWPRAFFEHEGRRVLLLSATLEEGQGAPGGVIALDRDRVVVATGVGALRLVSVKPEGGRAMDAAAWARGRRVVVGTTLG